MTLKLAVYIYVRRPLAFVLDEIANVLYLLGQRLHYLAERIY